MAILSDDGTVMGGFTNVFLVCIALPIVVIIVVQIALEVLFVVMEFLWRTI